MTVQIVAAVAERDLRGGEDIDGFDRVRITGAFDPDGNGGHDTVNSFDTAMITRIVNFCNRELTESENKKI